MFKGNFTVVVTPFQNNEIDWQSFQNLVEWQLSQEISGIVLCGTNSECFTLSEEEKLRTIKVAKGIIGNKIPVVVGTGLCSTIDTISFSQKAVALGADALLIITPYYIKPNSLGIQQYYTDVAENIKAPIILYNNPKRTGVDMLAEHVAELANEIPNIVGIKDASGDISRPLQHKNLINKEFTQLCGDDLNAVAFNANGGCGIISVASNLIPKTFSEIQQLTLEGDFKKALEIQLEVTPLLQDLFSEPSPAPVKNALYQLGLIKSAEVRKPLTNASDKCNKLMSQYINTLKIAV